MTVVESLNKLKQTFIKFHVERTGDKDPGYVWWERMQDCKQWSDKEKTYVPMSNSQRLKIMRSWVKEQKQLNNQI